MREFVPFGILGFVFGFYVFTLWWTWPRENRVYEPEMFNGPRYWALGSFAGFIGASAFWFLGRVL
jgi:hypothetical protein